MLEPFRALLSLMTVHYRRKVYVLLMGGAAMALLDAAAFGLLYPFLESLTQSPTSSLAARSQRLLQHLLGATTRNELDLRLGLLILLLFLLDSAAGICLTRAQSKVVAASEAEMSTRLFRVYMDAPYQDHLNRNSAELVRNVHTACGDMHAFVLMSYLVLVANVTSLLAMVAVISLVSPIAVGIVAGYFTIVMVVYVRFVGPRAKRAGSDYFLVSADALRMSQEGFGGIKTFQAFGVTKTMIGEYDEARRRLARNRFEIIYYSQLPQYYLQTSLIFGVACFAGAISVIHLHNPLALVGLIGAASFRVMPTLYTSLTATTRIRNGERLVTDLAADLENGCHARHPGAGKENIRVQSSDALMDLREKVVFENVGFAYQNTKTPAIDNLSFEIPRGSSLGLVGRSGAGKTTVVDLLLGLFPPTSGRILIDGTPLTSETVQGWRRGVGYVPQDVFLLDATIRDNVRFVRCGEPQDSRVWKALEEAQVADFVRGLPEQLDTWVGERGVRLSGGQRQRIGIARALHRRPQVLVLDEATSALDTATEAAITDTLRCLSGGYTIVVVTHRLSSVKYCDNLVLMDDGRGVAAGTFTTLQDRSGLFAELTRYSRVEA
jgi:ABC-type multidrug transport system fused ATPase/permease subunit